MVMIGVAIDTVGSIGHCLCHCLYTLPGLREIVPLSISQDLSDLPTWAADMEDVPVMTVYLQRRWARISRQYMEEYRRGADVIEAAALQHVCAALQHVCAACALTGVTAIQAIRVCDGLKRGWPQRRTICRRGGRNVTKKFLFIKW